MKLALSRFFAVSLIPLQSGVLFWRSSQYLLRPRLCSRRPPPHQHHDHASMAMDEPIDPAQQAKLIADKRESEFNHHLAGFFLVLAGILIFAEPSSATAPFSPVMPGPFVFCFPDYLSSSSATLNSGPSALSPGSMACSQITKFFSTKRLLYFSSSSAHRVRARPQQS